MSGNYLVLLYNPFDIQSRIAIFENGNEVAQQMVFTDVNLLVSSLLQLSKETNITTIKVCGPDFILQQLKETMPSNITIEGV